MLGYTAYRDWSPGGATAQQQLSVVTTVWGVTTSTQSGPHGGFSGGPAPAGNPNYGNSLNKGQPAYQTGYRQTGPGVGSYGAGNGMNGGEGGYGGGNALSTAAMVAAATATATATASVVALQDNSQFNNQQYSQGYQQRMMPMNGMNSMNAMNAMNPMTNMANMGMGNMHSSMMSNMGGTMVPKMSIQSPGPTNNSMYPRRMAPYPSPAMHMSQKRGQQTYPTSGPCPTMNPNMNPNFNPNGQYPAYGTRQPTFNQYPTQQTLGPTGNFGPGSMGPVVRSSGTLRQTTPPYTNQGQYFSNSPINPMNQFSNDSQYMARSSNGQYANTNQFQQDVAMRNNMNYQHSPIPGNPTPPLTPASSMPPYISPNPDVKPNFNEMKPPLPTQKDDELRLTFPVRDGIILPPFRLEHNLAVSNHVFQLKPTVHQTLMWRSDLELQLKCFHHEDRQMNTNWPASVQVSVNATPLVIDRGENKTSHKPLYLKEVCQPGRNTIQITVAACCCSHLFVLQLVHRPSVRSVLQGLLRKRLLTADHCIAKIKRNFSNSGSGSNMDRDRDAVEQTALKVSLKCPITFKRITLPARGHECKHVQCFDLESYLQLNCERGSWRCPVCNKPAQLEGLEIDQYMWGILNTLSNSEVDEVTIDNSANWKAAKGFGTIKMEDDNDSCGAKRLNKAMSPGSMTLPTMNNWDMSQAMSPYIPPDMNSIASGSMMNGPPSYNNSRTNQYDFTSSSNSGSNEYTTGNGPLSHLSDSVNSLDPLNAMEKSLNEQMPHTPHTPHTPNTPHTPGGTPGSAHTPGGGTGPPSVPPASDHHNNSSSSNASNSNSNNNSGNPDNTVPEIPSDLNFDPAAVIDGEGTGQEALNLLPDSVDPMELLSYLDPPDLNTPPSSGSSAGHANTSTSDDILALFE